MAHEYGQSDRNQAGVFLMGLLAGTALGAGLGVLFAPRPGRDLRNQLSDTAGRMQRAAAETYQQASEKVNDAVEQGRDAYERARRSVETGASGGRT